MKIRLLLKKRKKKSTRRWWIKSHITTNMGQNFGAHHALFMYFQMNDHEEFFKLTSQ